MDLREGRTPLAHDRRQMPVLEQHRQIAEDGKIPFPVGPEQLSEVRVVVDLRVADEQRSTEQRVAYQVTPQLP